MENEKIFIQAKRRKSISYKIGMGLLMLAIICWLLAAIVPMSPFLLTTKASLITGAFIIGEILFWIGALLVGKEVAAKFKSFLNPKNWRLKRESKQNEK